MAIRMKILTKGITTHAKSARTLIVAMIWSIVLLLVVKDESDVIGFGRKDIFSRTTNPKIVIITIAEIPNTKKFSCHLKRMEKKRLNSLCLIH